MKPLYFVLYRLTSFIALVIASSSCHSVDNQQFGPELVRQVLEHYLPQQLPGAVSHRDKSELVYKQADFNGDGWQDLAILITPVKLPVNHKQIIISRPWSFPALEPSAKMHPQPYRTSLLIVQPKGSDWLAENTRIDLLVDTRGVMETPSFELLVKYKNGEPIVAEGTAKEGIQSYDVIILPTEAGIDTYIYWNGSGFELYQPEDIP